MQELGLCNSCLVARWHFLNLFKGWRNQIPFALYLSNGSKTDKCLVHHTWGTNAMASNMDNRSASRYSLGGEVRTLRARDLMATHSITCSTHQQDGLAPANRDSRTSLFPNPATYLTYKRMDEMQAYSNALFVTLHILLVRMVIIIIIYLNCKWFSTRWQWYYNRTTRK
jgi:hypothetical protein